MTYVLCQRGLFVPRVCPEGLKISFYYVYHKSSPPYFRFSNLLYKECLKYKSGEAKACKKGEPITQQLLFNTVYMVEDLMDEWGLQDTPWLLMLI